MAQHRFRNQLETYRVPPPATPAVTPGSFLVFPLAWAGVPAQFFGQTCLYQRAWQEAQAVARPSLPERDLLAVWN